MSKRYDLAVKVREYQDRDGNTKAEWKNVGAVIDTKNGGMCILLDRTFNPAGLPDPDGRGNVLISMFEPRDDNARRDEGRPGSRDAASRSGGRDSGSLADELDDSIPF